MDKFFKSILLHKNESRINEKYKKSVNNSEAVPPQNFFEFSPALLELREHLDLPC